MKISKLIYIFILLINLVMLTSCSKIKTTNDAEYFLDVLYDYSKGEIKNGCIIDLRPLINDESQDDYDHGHINGALSYDFNNQNKETFITWITGLKSKKATIILVDSGNNEYQTIIKYLEEAGYKNIICYTLGYQSLKQSESFNIIVEEKTGTYDCGC